MICKESDVNTVVGADASAKCQICPSLNTTHVTFKPKSCRGLYVQRYQYTVFKHSYVLRLTPRHCQAAYNYIYRKVHNTLFVLRIQFIQFSTYKPEDGSIGVETCDWTFKKIYVFDGHLLEFLQMTFNTKT